ncbi:transcriptional repressor [Ruminococcaceae bacterium OttesenSCG-928-O06]|nr:transcriptional repressor [Ruminococcaceae bacterium OttesenSCG-928-O06]
MPNNRNTIQRSLVLQAVQAMHNHPTAQQVYQHLAQSHPTLSQATVYRNLNLLAQQGRIRRVSHLNAADRFDFELRPHYHFRCTACGDVYDAPQPYMEELLAPTGVPEGFAYHNCEVTFTGLCPHCNKASGKPPQA